MNKQTKAYRKLNKSTKVVKGANVSNGGALSVVEFDKTKGRSVDSHKERQESGQKPWKGCGDALDRNRK